MPETPSLRIWPDHGNGVISMAEERPKDTLPSLGLIDINKKKEKEAAAAKAKAETPQGDVLSLRKNKKEVARGNSGVKGGQGFQAFGKTDQNTPGTLMRRGSPLAISKDWLRENPEYAKKRPDMDRRLANVLERNVYGSNAAGTKETPKKDEGRKTFGSRFSGPTSKRPADKAEPRKAAGTYTKSYDVKPPKPKVKPVTGASGSSAGDKKAAAATDKSRTAGKMTAFQRQKARQFEKEGFAGRSMTRAQAQRKATEKPSGGVKFSLAGMFGKKSGAPKSAPGKTRLSSEFAKKNLAANQKLGKKR